MADARGKPESDWLRRATLIFLSDGGRRLAGSWVRFADLEESVVLIEESSNSDAKALGTTLTPRLRSDLFASGEFAAARVWTDNWQPTIPYLVANRGLAKLSLAQAIVGFLKGAQRLLTIERELATMQPCGD